MTSEEQENDRFATASGAIKHIDNAFQGIGTSILLLTSTFSLFALSLGLKDYQKLPVAIVVFSLAALALLSSICLAVVKSYTAFKRRKDSIRRIDDLQEHAMDAKSDPEQIINLVKQQCDLEADAKFFSEVSKLKTSAVTEIGRLKKQEIILQSKPDAQHDIDLDNGETKLSMVTRKIQHLEALYNLCTAKIQNKEQQHSNIVSNITTKSADSQSPVIDK